MTCRCSVKSRKHRAEKKQKICAECEHLDKGIVYATLAPQYMCSLTGETHFIMDDCTLKEETNVTGKSDSTQ